jgi:4-hydroxy-tetrahydrodipicolinate reductase
MGEDHLTQPVRVIQWATGRAGIPALRAIIDRPDTDLVGLYVSSPAKEGRDAGELCDRGPTGVKATREIDLLLAEPADVVCYCATDVGRVAEVIDDLCRILAAGKDVVTITPTQLFHIPTADPQIVGRLTAACVQGGSTLHFTGIFPGYLCDSLVFSLANLSHDIKSITMAEMLEISSYDPAMLKALGFGADPATDAEQFPTEFLNFYWESILHYLADAFGIVFDEVRHFRESASADVGFVTSGGLEVAAGGIAALHWGLEGVVNGRRRVCVEHYERLQPEGLADPAPHWPIPPGNGGYRFTVAGKPGMAVDLAFDGDPLTDAMAATANRAVNVLAAVHDAEPGIIADFRELPLHPGRMADE